MNVSAEFLVVAATLMLIKSRSLLPAEEEVDLDAKVEGAAPTDPLKRRADIIAAIELIVQKAEREDFTAAGLPHPKAVSKITGYTISAKERDEAWQEINKSED